MNRMTPTFIAVCLAGLIAGTSAASAQTVASQAPAQAAAQADLQVAAQADIGQVDATGAATANVAPGDNIAEQTPYNCLQYTGSRIRTADRKTGKPACAQGPGRTYSRDDIDRTGQVDLADALRHLDPSIK